jgi:hypothetical protein
VSGPFITAALLAWLTLVGAGMAGLWKYAGTPGTAATAPATWPNQHSLLAAGDRPTLVMFAHPKCPCTRASIGELSILMSHVQGQVAAHVIFFRPATPGVDWDDTDLRRSAAAIPGVEVSSDRDGALATVFGAEVSGQTFLYDVRGRLLFSGGMTYARGHSGDNPGRDALLALLSNGQPANARPPVFGCALRGATE